jgi:C-terminal processing protease CtpA/Prc
MTYWFEQSPIDRRDLDQVGIVLARMNGVTTIASIAKKDGVPTVAGVQPGDKLLKIDNQDTATLKRGELLNALHGKPGDHKRLLLERGGTPFEIDAVVTAF